jgi:TrmH family RNA methyltransferase
MLVVLTLQPLPLPETLSFAFIPDQLRDPGNLGTMLRTAASAGVQAVFCPPETADAFSPKVLRAGMGAHFRLPVHTLDWDAITSHLATLKVILAAMEQGLPYTQADLRPPLALIVGGRFRDRWLRSPDLPPGIAFLRSLAGDRRIESVGRLCRISGKRRPGGWL